ncbi:glycosyl hydrolase family 28-related protein [Bacillus sp. CECT 9360]|uniref:glycosyl hydrolase family 28-related protein n=1 Tax=Bacillus sp. CECT 9360 TaxID=2845821 RepID=UPI001E574611|nr:glycosyl hydrolase family 28-related protein [Bacillus sp. CECT 9360]CAH0345158.1 hypothetical protein BCI9360_01437 [Bacillus sp. CECT 9360]
MNSKKWIIGLLVIGLFVFHTDFSSLKASAATVINVKSYGAKGNGKTDDTNAIQKAITAAKDKQVLIPKGTYRVRYLSIPSNVTIIGTSAILKSLKPYSYVMKINGSKVRIEGLVVDGNNQSVQGVYISPNMNDITITKTVIQNITQAPLFKKQIPVGIRLDGNASQVTFDAVQVKNINGKYNIGNSKQAAGMMIAPSKTGMKPGKKVVIKNSLFDRIGPRNTSDAILVKGFTQPTDVAIENNTFTRVRDRAIEVRSPGVTIKKNKIINSFNKNNPGTIATHNQFDMTSAIYITSDDVVVDGNNISGAGSYFAAIELTGTNNVQITNNTISNGANYSNSDLIRINATSTGPNAKASLQDINITDNTLKNGFNGIRLTSGIGNFVSTENEFVNVK